MKESEFVVQRRKECIKMCVALRPFVSSALLAPLLISVLPTRFGRLPSPGSKPSRRLRTLSPASKAQALEGSEPGGSGAVERVATACRAR
jgi:hypothetical protein